MEDPLAEYTGRRFCQTSLFAISAGLYITSWLKMGIALMRLMYVCFSQWLFTENVAALVISATAVTFGTITGIVYIRAPKRVQDLDTVCQDYSQDMAMTLYHIRAPNQEPVTAHVCLIVAQLAYMSQFAVYLVIFKHLWQHDKKMCRFEFTL